MKKIVLLIVLFVFNVSFSQTNNDEENEFNGFSKGDFALTGTISFNSLNIGGDTKNNKLAINPQASYFISDNISVGISVGYSLENRDEYVVYPLNSTTGFSSTVAEAEVKTTTMYPSIFSRYYFTPKNKFSLFTGISFSYLAIKYEATNSSSVFDTQFPNILTSSYNIKRKGVSTSFMPGINYFISDNFALDASIGLVSYSSIKDDVDGAEATNTFDIGFDFSNINLGLVYRF